MLEQVHVGVASVGWYEGSAGAECIDQLRTLAESEGFPPAVVAYQSGNLSEDLLQRFRDGWGEYLRAELPEKSDREVTEPDHMGKTLYLFGDPGSNSVLRRLLPKLFHSG